MPRPLSSACSLQCLRNLAGYKHSHYRTQNATMQVQDKGLVELSGQCPGLARKVVITCRQRCRGSQQAWQPHLVEGTGPAHTDPQILLYCLVLRMACWVLMAQPLCALSLGLELYAGPVSRHPGRGQQHFRYMMKGRGEDTDAAVPQS